MGGNSSDSCYGACYYADMQEEWRPIIGYDGYEISNLGRVRSFRPINRCSPAPNEPRMLAPFTKGRRKYLYCSLRKEGKLWSARVHHLVLEAFVGVCPEGLQGCHADDNQANNRIDNLYWGTQKQNVADKIRNGKQVRGSLNHFASIDEQMVRTIKEALLRDPHRGSIGRISEATGVSRHIISNIKNGKSWLHI